MIWTWTDLVRNLFVRSTCLGISLFAMNAIANRVVAVDSAPSASGYIEKNFTVEDGLLSNRVNTILQTRDGFLWVGTAEGLLRFDGRHFAPIVFLPQSSPASVTALAEAPDGALWVGTLAGLARIEMGGMSEPGHAKSALYHPNTVEGDSIQCLHFSRSGTLFVGTMTGMYRMDGDKLSVIIPKLWTSRIEEGSNGHLLVITSNGFMEWDGTEVIRHPEVSAKLGVHQNEIFHVYEDRTGTIWYCTILGLARQVGASIERLKSAKDAVFRVNEDAQGTIWFSQSGGLYRVGKSGRELIASNLAATYLCFDQNGDVWASTKGAGLYRFKKQAVKMFTAADGLPLGLPRAVLAASDGKLWVGSDCGGLSWFDGTRFHSYSEKQGLANSCVFSLAEDRNGDILIGTFGGGIFRYRKGQFTVFVKEDKLTDRVAVAILPARDGSLWIAYSDGVRRIQDGQVREFTTADGLSSDKVLSAYMDGHGVIWVETTGGIDRWEKDRFVAVSKTNNASTNSGGFGFGEDEGGELFAFGPLGGTYEVQENRVVRVDIAPKITGMLSTREALWFCGDGIYRAAPDSLEKWEKHPDAPPNYTRFDRADGMNSAECTGGFRNMAMTKDGRIWVATEQGVAMLESSTPPHRAEKPALYMEKIVIGKTAQPVGRELVVPPGTHHLELHFDAIELTSPERVRFQYRMDDVDREWLDADATVTAVYTGLPVGVHDFHVRASNVDGEWDQTGIVYKITKEPYFYQTTWLRLLCVVAFLGLVALLFRMRLRQMAQRFQLRMEERVNERTRIARELHDTLLQSFQGTLLHFQTGINLLPEHSGEAQKRLQKAMDLAAEAIDEGREAIQGLRSSVVETNELAAAIRTLGEELAASDSVAFSVQQEGTSRNLHPIVRDEVYRIVGEAMRNAFHHAEAKQIEAEIRYDDQGLRVRARDDGKGIDPKLLRSEEREGHFGLRGMEERAKLIGGKLAVWSERNVGTEVELTVPAGRAYTSRKEGWRAWVAEKFWAKLGGRGPVKNA
jgi:signal transduction histidine kinase/ligand-binding sensor domain-containing protein